MTELSVEENSDIRSGYSITLNFSTNPFFSNSFIEKRLCYREGGELVMQTTPIEWKEGQRPVLHDDNENPAVVMAAGESDAEGKVIALGDAPSYGGL